MSAAVRPLDWSMRMSTAPSSASANPRAGSSRCIELTPRSKSTPLTRGVPSRASTAGSSSYTAGTSVVREAYGSRRSRATSNAWRSRSRPTRRASGSTASSAAACPPSPTVASTSTAPGAARAGASRATTLSRSTGAWVGTTSVGTASVGTGSSDEVERDRDQGGEAGGDGDGEREQQRAAAQLLAQRRAGRDVLEVLTVHLDPLGVDGWEPAGTTCRQGPARTLTWRRGRCAG